MCTRGCLTNIYDRLLQIVLGRDTVFIGSELGLDQAMRMEHVRMPKPAKILRESEMSLLASSARRWIVLRAAMTEDSFFLSKSDDRNVALHQIPLHEVDGISAGTNSQTVVQPLTISVIRQLGADFLGSGQAHRLRTKVINRAH